MSYAGDEYRLLAADELLHVEIEVRLDLIATEAGQIKWAKRIATALRDAEGTLPESDQ
jgi:predicted N-formylglutamate amidohydrolase